MKAEIITLNPEKAKQLLEMNINNRKLKTNYKNGYVKQMKEGNWKENGEPIILDTNGIVKDGQHRLYAVIESGVSYKVPLISNVSPDVMDTIDTGTNRSISDVLELNGFKYVCLMATTVKTIIKHNQGLTASSNGSAKIKVSNSSALEYAKTNKEKLYNICRHINTIKDKSHNKLLTTHQIVWCLYVIAGLDWQEYHIKFINGIISGCLGENSSTYYAYKKLLSAKTNKIGLSGSYVFNLIIRTWNVYASGDMPIKRMTVSTEKLEKPIYSYFSAV